MATIKPAAVVHMVSFDNEKTYCGKSALFDDSSEGTWSWDDVTCFECVVKFREHLETQKKLCYQYISGDQLELSDPELLESLNEKIEKCEALLQKLDQ